MLKSRGIVLLTALITLVGFYIRLKGTLEGYFAFTYDQGRDLLAVYNLVNNHKLSLIGPTTGLPGVFYGPWWYWFLVPSFLMSSGDPTSSVVFIALINVLMIPLGFILGRDLGGDVLGVVLALLFAFSPPLIASSTQLWNPNLVPFFTLVSLFILKKIGDGKSSWYMFVLFGLAIGFVFEFQMAFGLFFTIAMVLTIGILKMRGGKNLDSRSLIFSILAFGFVLFPRLIFDLRHDFLISRSFITHLKNPPVFQKTTSLAERFISRSNQFFILFTKTFSGENRILGILLLVLISYLIASTFRKSANNLKLFTAGNLVIIGILLVGFIFYPDAVWDYYLIGLPVIFIVLVSIALVQLKRLMPKAFIWLSLLLLITVSQPSALINSFNSDWEGDASVFRNQNKVIDYIYQKANNEPFSVIVYTPALIDYQYRYLFIWRGKKVYGYTPLERKKLVFYILEPDDQKDRRLRWLKEHEGDGIVVEEKILTGDIVVQKHVRKT